MELQKLLSKARRAAEDYDMIDEGDKIAVGLSGGKDSITLLYILATMRRFYPKKFEVVAITVDMGLEYDKDEVEALKKLCEELKEKAGIEVDRKTVSLNAPINRVGEFTMLIKLTSKVKSELKVVVTASEVVKESIEETEDAEA